MVSYTSQFISDWEMETTPHQFDSRDNTLFIRENNSCLYYMQSSSMYSVSSAYSASSASSA